MVCEGNGSMAQTSASGPNRANAAREPEDKGYVIREAHEALADIAIQYARACCIQLDFVTAENALQLLADRQAQLVGLAERFAEFARFTGATLASAAESQGGRNGNNP